MSNPNPLNRHSLGELADQVEHQRGPVLVERWRQAAAAGNPVPAWRMRRQLREAFRDEWRRRMDSTSAGSGKGRRQAGLAPKAVVTAFRQLDQELDAQLLAADPAAMPKLAGDAIRRRAGR